MPAGITSLVTDVHGTFTDKALPQTAQFPWILLGELDITGNIYGAQEKTRTSTILRSLAPEASASTNSATWARGLL